MNGKIIWHQVALALLIGFALGAAFGQWYTKTEHHGYRWKGSDMKQRMMERFDRQLHLTPGQKQQVSAIFEATHSQMRALQMQMRPKFENLHAATRIQIRQILTPDQQVKFDEMDAKMERHRREREKTFNS